MVKLRTLDISERNKRIINFGTLVILALIAFILILEALPEVYTEYVFPITAPLRLQIVDWVKSGNINEAEFDEVCEKVIHDDVFSGLSLCGTTYDEVKNVSLTDMVINHHGYAIAIKRHNEEKNSRVFFSGMAILILSILSIFFNAIVKSNSKLQ